MKTLIGLIMILVTVTSSAGQRIEPQIASGFGVMMSLEVEFVDKPRTYYAMNIVKSPWSAKIIAINGKRLEQPVVIEYSSSIKDFKKGARYQLRGYEDIFSLGQVRNNRKEVIQVVYRIRHKIVFTQIAKDRKKR